MSRLVVLALIGAAAVVAAPAAADAARYKGKTKGGQKITFNAKGKKVAKVRSLIYVICFRSNASQTDGGVELFHPPGKFRLGRKGKKQTRRPSAVRGGKQTFNYELVPRRRSKKRIVGKLRLWYWESIYDFFTNEIYFWNCSGSTKFKARKR